LNSVCKILTITDMHASLTNFPDIPWLASCPLEYDM